MALVLAIAVGMLVVGVVITLKEPWKPALLILFVTLAVLPRNIFTIVESSNTGHVGIASDGIQLRTYVLAIVLAVFVAFFHRYRTGAGGFVVLGALFGVAILIWQSFVWVDTMPVLSGEIHILTAVVAFFVGTSFGRASSATAGDAFIAKTILFVVAVQLPVLLLQMAGVPLFATEGTTAMFEGARPNGTFAHPGTMGKVYLLLLVLTLPLTRATLASTRRWANFAVILMIPGIVITASRTNAVAVGSALVLWYLFASGLSSARKVLGLLFVGVIGIASVPVWQDRVTNGEDGTIRARLTATASEWIGRQPLSGVGPNNFVPVVGQTDGLVGAGWPVHNVLLLLVAELGLVVAALFLSFYVATLARAASRALGKGSSSWAAALLVTAPGLLAIAWTGWGLLAELLPLWFFVLGFALSRMKIADERFGVTAEVMAAETARTRR